MSDPVEERIKKHYYVDGGDWLVEKGKLTEARLLKEAYHRIISLKKEKIMYMDWYKNEKSDNAQIQAEVELREKILQKSQRQIAEQWDRIKDLYTSVQTLADKHDVSPDSITNMHYGHKED